MGKAPLILPRALAAPVERLAAGLFSPPGMPPVDFASPPGEPALVAPDSVSWRVFRNPVTLFIGGVAAVLLELAEPRVRHGVWDPSGFPSDPLLRLQRTGLAAMMTVYGPESAARAMIEGVNRMHARVGGTTPGGLRYRADDPELLLWVQATASWGFLEARSAYVAPLPHAERDLYYAEAAPVAGLYGAVGVPLSHAELDALLDRFRPKLEPSPILFEFLAIMARAPILPAAARPLQKLLLAAAVDLLPADIAVRLRLSGRGLAAWQRPPVRALARFADRLPLRTSPAVQASLRLGLPADYLYRTR